MRVEARHPRLYWGSALLALLLLGPACHWLLPYGSADDLRTKKCRAEVWYCPTTAAAVSVTVQPAAGSTQVSNYQVVPGLWTDKGAVYHPYYNSPIVLKAVPDQVKGATLISTGVGDWKVNSAAFMQVHLATDAESLYVAYDSRAVPPSWLTGDYTRQAGTVRLSQKNPATNTPYTLDLWRRNGDRSPGEVITIPGNSFGNPGFQNISQGSPFMYIVLVEPTKVASCDIGHIVDSFEQAQCPENAGDDLRPATLAACQLQHPNLVCRNASCQDGELCSITGSTMPLRSYPAGSLVEFVPPSSVQVTIEGNSQSADVTGSLRFAYEGDLTTLTINDLLLEAGDVSTQKGTFEDVTLVLWSLATTSCVGSPPGFAMPCDDYRIGAGSLRVSASTRFQGENLMWLSDNAQPIDVHIDHASRTFAFGGSLTLSVEVGGETSTMDVTVDLRGYIADVLPQAVGDLESDLLAECVEDRNDGPVVLNAAGSFDVYAPSPANLPLYEWYEDFGLATQHAWGTGLQVVIPRGALAYGSHQITLLVGDQDGRTDTDTFDVLVGDGVPPVFDTVPQDVITDIYPAGTQTVTVDLGTYSARDACSSPVLVTHDGPQDGVFTPGTHTVTWTADDLRGNTTSVVQTVRVRVLAGPFPWPWVIGGAAAALVVAAGVWWMLHRRAAGRRQAAEAETPPPPPPAPMPGAASPWVWLAVGVVVAVVAAGAVITVLLLRSDEPAPGTAGTATSSLAGASTTQTSAGGDTSTSAAPTTSQATSTCTAPTTSQATSTSAAPTTEAPTTTEAPPTTPGTSSTLAGPVLDPSAEPTYGDAKLITGFLTDPAPYPMTAGGPVDLTGGFPGGGCTGFAARNPDFRFDWVGSGLLRFYFIPDDPQAAGADTVLIINDPWGNWHCVDDSWGTAQPTIDFNPSVNGLYEIWIGTYNPGYYIPGTLYITELDDNHP